MTQPEQRVTVPGGSRGKRGWIGRAIALVWVLGLLVLLVLWFVVRVEVNADEVLIIVNKGGHPIPADLGPDFADQVVLYPELVRAIAGQTGKSEEWVRANYKGTQYEVRTEGRYFPNPYEYKCYKRPVTVISQNEVGVLVRRFGRPLPYPKTVATEPDERGPVAEVLTPGRYPVNVMAYEVKKFPAVEIPPGHVGVVTLLSSAEAKEKNTYTVGPGERGVQRETLRPGLEYFNPYLKHVDVVDVRNRTYHMLGEDALTFPSNDSFNISIEGTIEWSIQSDRVAEVTVAYGDERDVIDKVILPYARSVARIEGSKLQARDFISGKTRTAFQERLLKQLQDSCGQCGITIHSALVREIKPPAEIATLISQREQADQEIERSHNQIEEAKAEALLVEQKEMSSRNTAIGETKRKNVAVTKAAEQQKVIAVTQATQELEVAKLRLEAARRQAEALVARGQAEAKVVLFGYQARAEPLGNAVAAFGDGQTYAQHYFLQHVAPSIRSILSNTEGPFADIFKAFAQPAATTDSGAAKRGKP